MIKVRPLSILKLLKFEKIKYPYFFHFWPLGLDIDDFCFGPVYMFGRNNLKVISLLPEAALIIFKVNNLQPSDTMHFLRETKS